jgi:hypothetical protein
MLTRHSQRMLGLCLALAIIGMWVGGYAATRLPDVQYVPTPHEVVDEMLQLANMTKDDVIYDLGCGDGRLVIAAAKQYGARGVGVDIDPQRISESRANARQAGVADRVRFLEQDLFETDIREATVVTLYLLPRLNVQLRPTLLHDLKPGTRIVSHDFDMAEWKPDQTRRVAGPSRQHPVYFWVIPANVEGTWRMQVAEIGDRAPSLLRIQQQYQEVSGTAQIGGQEVPITKATLSGDHLRFALNAAAHGDMSFDGRVNGQTIDGSVEIRRGANMRRYPWTSQREAAPTNGTAPR